MKPGEMLADIIFVVCYLITLMVALAVHVAAIYVGVSLALKRHREICWKEERDAVQE